MNTTNPIMNIRELRQAGNKVRIEMYRYMNGDNKKLIPLSAFRAFGLQDSINPKGGRITIRLFSKTGKTYVSESVCALEDSFSRKEGLKIATARLNEELAKDSVKFN